MHYQVEITDAGDPRSDVSLTEGPIESESPIPIPSVGEHLTADNKPMTVVSRLFHYYEDTVHVQLYCAEGHLDSKGLQDPKAKFEFKKWN